jgi:SagB-type dehydrogenase family enzyme
MPFDADEQGPCPRAGRGRALDGTSFAGCPAEEGGETVMARGQVLHAAAPAHVLELPGPKLDGGISVERALAMRRSVRRFGHEAIESAQLGQLLWAAQGVTDADGSRTAPSAGGLHPLKTYVIVERVESLDPGLYSYLPQGHRLRALGDDCLLPDLVALTWEQDWMSGAAAVIALTADDSAVMERYGPRARRYVEIEAGHALQNAHLEATALGLGSVIVGAYDDFELARRLGCERRERPLCLLVVGRG